MTASADVVRPNDTQVRFTTTRSFLTWKSFLRDGRCKPLSSSCLDPQVVSNSCPMLPDQKAQGRLKLSEKNNTLFAQGYAEWNVQNGDICFIPRKIRPKQCLTIGVLRPTTCNFDGLHKTDMHYISVLMLAWSYILSVRLVELQGEFSERTGVFYTEAAATVNMNGKDNRFTSAIPIIVGQVNDVVVRWWAAILASSTGWKAVIYRSGQSEYLPPWGIQMQSAFEIHCTPSEQEFPSGLSKPPNAHEAILYVSAFCDLHDLRWQSAAALAAVLMLPTHSQFKSIAEMEIHPQLDSLMPSGPRPEVLEAFLPQLMALSIKGKGIMSIFCGTFWDPGTDCNLAGAWLAPVLDVIETLSQASDSISLIRLFVSRRPNVAFLWLGAIITGLVPRVIRCVRSGIHFMDDDAAAWTRCVQSFMYLDCNGPYVEKGLINRADVWRLHFITNEQSVTYRHSPLSPFQPFGKVPLHETSLEVREHSSCERHNLRYTAWHWVMQEHEIREELSCSEQPVPPSMGLGVDSSDTSTETDRIDTDLLERLSENATRSVFRWAFEDGVGVSDLAVSKHEWIREDDADDDEADEEVDSTSADSVTSRTSTTFTPSRVQNWMETINKPEMEVDPLGSTAKFSPNQIFSAS